MTFAFKCSVGGKDLLFRAFNGPLYIYYIIYKFSTGLFPSRTTPLAIMLGHIRGSVVIGEVPVTDCTHRETMTVSIISRWDFVFNMTYNKQPDMKKKQSDWKNSSQCMLLMSSLIYLRGQQLIYHIVRFRAQ